MAGRPNNQVEMRLVGEWLRERRAQYWYQMRVRLGRLSPELDRPDLSEAERRLVHGAFARWADALVELPDRTELIEAKIVAAPGAIAQLELYERLLPETPDLAHRRGLPITLVLLYAVEDPDVSALAREKGIMLEQYRPSWVDEHLGTLRARQRTPVAAQLAAALRGGSAT